MSREKKKRKGVGTTSHEATLFEYGESIAGYKCVTTESERDRLKRSHESENSSESEVDVFAFDQAKVSALRLKPKNATRGPFDSIGA